MTLLIACSPPSVPVAPALAPGAPIIRLGQVSAALFESGGTRPVLISREIILTELPASRLLLGAIRHEGEATQCHAMVMADELDAPRDVTLELLGQSVSPAQWTDVEIDLPAISSGVLRLKCDVPEDSENAVVWSQPIAIPQAKKPAPLIVLLSLDTMRADHMPGLGGAPLESPNLHRITQAGLRFSNAQAEATWTLPSHFSLMTSYLFGMTGTPARPNTLAAHLAVGGFITAGSTGGGFIGADLGFSRGFDFFTDRFEEENDLDRMTDEGLTFLNRFGDAPSFLFLHTYAVHESPPAYKEWFKVAKYGHGPYKPGREQLDEDAAFYRNLVRNADLGLGPLFARFEAEALRRPVLLVIVSDHGQAFGEHDNYGHGVVSQMVTLHDEIIRVPIIIWSPDLIKPGGESTWPVSLSDIAPTILRATGRPIPVEMKGRDLWPLWTGADSSTESETETTIGVVSHVEGQWAYRTDRYKLIVWLARKETKRYEVYDIAADPNESKNLSGDRPELVARLEKGLRDELKRRGVLPLEATEAMRLPNGDCDVAKIWLHCDGGFSPEETEAQSTERVMRKKLRDELRALGYTE